MLILFSYRRGSCRRVLLGPNGPSGGDAVPLVAVRSLLIMKKLDMFDILDDLRSVTARFFMKPPRMK